MEVDLSSKKITWKVYFEKDCPKIIYQISALPTRMKNKPLFIHITMKENNDILDIITD